MKASWTPSFRGKIKSLIILPEAPGEFSWVCNSPWVFSSTSVSRVPKTWFVFFQTYPIDSHALES